MSDEVSGEHRSGDQVAHVWAAFTEVNRQLRHAGDADVRIDLQIVKENLRSRLAELGNDTKPEATRAELREELEARKGQLSKIRRARIDITPLIGGATTRSGKGAEQINEAIDERFGREGVERRIGELLAALEELDSKD